MLSKTRWTKNTNINCTPVDAGLNQYFVGPINTKIYKDVLYMKLFVFFLFINKNLGSKFPTILGYPGVIPHTTSEDGFQQQ